MPEALRRLAACTTLCACAATLPVPAAGQAAPAPPPAAPTERAQRDADKVFRMILQHADTPRRVARDDKPAPVAAPASAAARAGAESRSAPRAVAPPPAAPTPIAEVPQAEPAVIVVSPPAPSAAAPVEAPLPAAPALAPVASLAPVPVLPPPRLELVSSVEPEFPSRLLRSIGSGKVLVNFDVRPDGTVARAEVLRSPHRGLNAAAEAAVMAWRFKPTGQLLPGQVELSFE